jgi:hypothetical protein
MYPLQSCYIEFRVTDTARFTVFLRFFEVLKSWTKQRGAGVTSIDDTQESRAVSMYIEDTLTSKTMSRPENWMLILRPADLVVLGMPVHAESIKAMQSWRGLSRRDRRKLVGDSLPLQVLSDFADMLKTFEEVEFDHIGIRQTSSDRARIDYNSQNQSVSKQAITEIVAKRKTDVLPRPS